MRKIRIAMLILLSVFLLGDYSTVSANAAEPPQLILNVTNIDEDIDLYLETDGSQPQKAMHKRKTWESQFFIYRGMSSGPEEMKSAQLVFKRGDEVLDQIDYPESEISRYNTVWLYDFDSKELTRSDTLTRQILLVGSRILITLLIEGIIFFLLGYREKKSWLAFLLVNLVTQGFLNYNLMGSTTGYVFLGFILMELLIFVIEGAVLPKLITEQSKRKTLGFVIIANMASLFFGGFAINNLPL